MQTHFTAAVDACYRILSSAVTVCDQHSGFVMAALTGTYVIATLVLVGLAYKQLRLNFQLERNRTRPMVVIDLLVEHYFVHVSLRNLGQTLAQNVKIHVQPEIRNLYGGKNLEGVLIDPPEEHDEAVPFLQNGVTSLAPGRELKGEIGFIGRFRSHYGKRQFKGSVSYSGSDGVKYSEPFVIDLAGELGLGHVERYEVHDVVEALRLLNKEVSKIAKKAFPE